MAVHIVDAIDIYAVEIGAVALDKLERDSTPVCGGDDERIVKGRMGAVGRDEVDDRQRVLGVRSEVDPTGVRRQLRVGGVGEELAPHRVQRRHAGVAATGNVDGRQIQRQTDQIAAQCFDDELVDGIADLARHAANDLACHFGLGDGSAIGEFHRIEEGFDQADVIGGEAGVVAVDGVGQHRVTEAVNDVCELSHNRRVDGGVVAAEDIDRWLNFAGEFLENEMLILHFVPETRGLEQALAVPIQAVDFGESARNGINVGDQPFVQEGDGHALGSASGEQGSRIGEHYCFRVFDQAVVFGVEDEVNRE